MRRVILLTLLAIGLSTAALADIEFSTGTFASGTFSGSFTTSLNVSVTGSLDTISITTGTLTMAAPGLFVFPGGSTTVSSGGTTLFTDTLAGTGTVTETGTTVGISGNLSPFTFNGETINSGTVNLSVTLQGNTVTDGSGSASLVTPIPEPGTFGLVGTGLIALAAMVRRKLKLPT